MEDPIVERIERTGYGFEEESPVCPCCGEECDKIFVVSYGEIVGCEYCIEERDAWQEDECFPWRGRR